MGWACGVLQEIDARFEDSLGFIGEKMVKMITINRLSTNNHVTDIFMLHLKYER